MTNICDGDGVFRTYLVTAHGDEAMGSTWSYLDITALGRQEQWEDLPEGYPQNPAIRLVGVARRSLNRSRVTRPHDASRRPVDKRGDNTNHRDGT